MSLLSSIDALLDPRKVSLDQLEALNDLLDEEAFPRTSTTEYELDADDVSPLLAAYRRQQNRQHQSVQLDWLRRCLADESLFEQALAVLTSAASDDAIQEQLLDICGYDHVDLVISAIQKRDIIRQEAQERDQRLADALSGQTAASHVPAKTMPLTNGRHKEEQEMQDRLQAALLQSKENALRDAQLRAAERPYGHTPAAQIQFTSVADKKRAKEERKAAQRAKKTRIAEGEDIGYTAEQLEQIRLEALEAAANRPLYDPDAVRVEETPQYPHVYTAGRGGSTMLLQGQRYSLPLGTTRQESKEYWEVTIPTPHKLPMREGESLINISELDAIAKGSFPGYKTLNRLQSLVYPVAYQTNENMLICAPTGAGKTDVAMLTVLRALWQYSDDVTRRPIVAAADFKVVYVAPMKALAAEVVRKMSKRLSWLGVLVRELTGDMQLTRAEIAATHFIVTTPEKWDVVTRKPEGDTELAGKVRLLIIDEVHLLHDDRGAVIESIVARTLRQVESSQLMIRIVGLSATLPNYVDVADFLRVNRFSGLFYFDSSFRPVPLEQHFLGVKGKSGSPEMRNNLDIAAYDKVKELIRGGHQVMVFVHSRKDTVKTAEMLRTRFREEQDLLDLIDPTVHPRYELFKRDLATSRNREMKELFEGGFGIHHAGMLRSDRTLSERLFEQDVTKVLVCTATLAWGVNLPAYAVVIKGTQIFDSAKGTFTDISILDVLQIFGRAGRPQYETHGVGYICTAYDKMDHYVSAITQQHPIESKFTVGLLDSLNAEIALGTVTSIDAGVRWIGYTYLFVRMRKNPLAYGIDRERLFDDPSLGSKRYQQISSAVKELQRAKMVVHDEEAGTLSATELGKIASKYYLRHASIEVFNEKFRASMSEAEALAVLSLSVEFDQLKVREAELDDLKVLEESVPLRIPEGSISTTPGKVNVLLQAYISRKLITDFALISDMGYVSQNAGRIARALLDIAISNRWSSTTAVMSSLCKAIENRRWSTAHPLHQIHSLSADTLHKAANFLADYDIPDIAELSAKEVGELIHLNERHGLAVQQAARQLPRLSPVVTAQPLAHDLLSIHVELKRDFDWSDKVHGRSEPFWVWVSDADDRETLQFAHVYVYSQPAVYQQRFVVSLPVLPPRLYLRIVSEKWFGSDEAIEIDLSSVQMPQPAPTPLRLLDVPLLRLADTQDRALTSVFGNAYPSLDPVMTQCFHTLMHTRANAFFGLSSPANVLTAIQLAVWRALRDGDPKTSVLLVSSQISLARRLADDLTQLFGSHQIDVALCNKLADLEGRGKPTVFVASPRLVLDSPFVQQAQPRLKAVILPHLHLFDASLELCLATLRRVQHRARFIGVSFPLADHRDLARCLGADEQHSYGFSPSARSEACEVVFQAFSTHHSAALLRAMVKPAFEAIAANSSTTLCIVPTRGQCRATAKDLATLIGADLEADTFGQAELDQLDGRLRDATLSEALVHGVGVWHDGLTQSDQRLVLQLCAAGSLRVLVLPRELIYNVPTTVAETVGQTIVMGAQTVVSDPSSQHRELRDYSLSDLVQCTNISRYSGPRKCIVMCQAQQAELFGRHLQAGLPLESQLMGEEQGERILRDHVMNELVAGQVKNRQDLVDLLSWTYLARRLKSNPHYHEEGRRSLSAVVDGICSALRSRGLLREEGGEGHGISATQLAKQLVSKHTSSSHLDYLLHTGFAQCKDLQFWGIEVDEAALRAWQGRLPKSAREGLEDKTAAPFVLLAGWFAGRTPADAKLEEAQATVVKTAARLIDAKMMT